MADKIEKKVKLWHERVQIAKKSLEQWADDSGATRFIKEYKGDYGLQFQMRTKKVPIPPINEVFAYVQADIASTFARDPYIAVNSKAGTPKGAALWEVILNYYWRELRNKEEMEYEIIDKDLVGYGFHKVGNYVSQSGSGDLLKVESKLYSKFVHWKDIVWNLNSKRPPSDCSWMAHRIVEPLNIMKKKHKNAKGLEGVPNPEINEETYKKAMYKDDIKMGVKWEIWDAEEKQIYLIADGLEDRWLEDPKDWPDYLDEFPFLMYWDFVVPNSARPMSSIAPWEAQILSEMVLMGQAINHAKRWNRQAFVRNGTIDDNALDKYERGDDGAVIVYNGDTADIKFADFGQLPTDFYLIMDRLQAIKRNINGQPEFARGGVTKTNTRTIGELQLMQEGNKSRQGRKVDRLETHMENIARHMMFHLKANFDVEETIKITGEVPETILEILGDNYNKFTGQVTFTPQEILGEYDVDIKGGSTLPMDKMTRTQTMEIILQTVAQAAAQGPLSNFVVQLIQELLKEYDIKSLQQAYQKDIDAAAEQEQKENDVQGVEIEKTLAEAEKRKAQAEMIHQETLEQAQDSMIGPIGRARIERIKKAPVGQNGNQR